MARLLLVDDDTDLAETLGEVFQMLDHDVQVAADGASAMLLLESGEFDVILLDWQLPDMTGIDVCRRYREVGGTAKVLMLTGMRDAASREMGSQAGVTSFLTKPFSLDQLTDTVNALL